MVRGRLLVLAAAQAEHSGRARGLLAQLEGTEAIFDDLANLFNLFEDRGRWPRRILETYVSLIPKDPEKMGPADLRPISVTSVVYRLWAAHRLSEVMQWQETWIHESVRGFRPHSGTEDVLAQVSLRLENLDPNQ